MVTNNLTYVVSLNNSALDVFYAKFHSDILHVYAFELEFISTSATMEDIRLFLCPEIPMDKIVERVQVVRKQLERDIETGLVPMIPDYRAVMCPMCQNTDEGRMIRDVSQGTLICTGSDGLGCGALIQENRLDEGFGCLVNDEEDQYSPQATFTSYTVGNRRSQKLNDVVERNLSRYLKDDMTTGDQYKDKQRYEAYRILDTIGMMCQVDREVVRSVKSMFHELRTRMDRIHKLNMLLCCLFHILMVPEGSG